MTRLVSVAFALAALVGCLGDVPPPLDVSSADDPAEAGVVRKSPPTQARTIRHRTNSIGMEFALIPAGAFEMGSDNTRRFEPYSRCEGPAHRVEITRPFWIGRHEVTVGQFRRFVEATGYRTVAEVEGTGCNGLDPRTGELTRRPEWIWSSPPFAQCDEHPVVCVDWADAVAFCEWLSRVEERRCRLPTEAEWEFACRAGSTTLFSSGDQQDDLNGFGNAGDLALLRAFPAARGTAEWDDRFAFTAPVGSFSPNEFGLHDMHGNVGEWCRDWFDAQAYWTSAAKNPAGPEEATSWRVVRGGSWYNTPASCRSAGRHDGIPTARSTTNGFRVVVESMGESQRVE